jgi:subtilisin-like proprotein convertase family protein
MHVKLTLLLAGTLLAGALAAKATLYSTNWNSGFANSGVIPDNSPGGWVDSRSVSAAPAGTLAGVAVDLQLSSGWAGDLYAYLVNGSGFAVLLNRVGTPGQPNGYGPATLNVTFADGSSWNGNSISGSIHTYGGGNVSGFWNPDNPNLPANSLGSFVGSSPNGTWSLFVADLNGGGLTTIQSWGLQMDIVAVPEVETWVAAALAGAFGAFWLNRQIWGAQTRP